ncbi:MAG: aminoacyl--tRNA ligase-related protein [Candidatus Paceibacterota bacterium]|jgi:prolyl-tRNA synthetase
MRQSRFFTKTRKEAPKDEVSNNASLLIRGGFIDKLQAGVYSYLPLGFRVLKKIENIIREELNKVGGQELLMPALQPKENWQKTGRWDSLDVLYKVTDLSGRENALGPTHEEIVVPLVGNFLNSYKDLPFSVYQFQTKFRMEARAKSGILRGREFVMKDMYSFHANEDDLKLFYQVVWDTYVKIFDRLGLGKLTYPTFASGGSFSKYSHEFQTVTPAGEDTIYICDDCKVAINKEIIEEQKVCPKCSGQKFREEKSIEVGNIFELKTKFSAPFGLTYKDESGNSKEVIMGCYGLGPSRVMGTIAEVFADKNGLVWPANVAPYRFHLIELDGSSNDDVRNEALKTYDAIRKDIGDEVLFDDRDLSAGAKFADSDLMGIPYRIVISKKTLDSKMLEVKDRKTGKIEMVSMEDLKKYYD